MQALANVLSVAVLTTWKREVRLQIDIAFNFILTMCMLYISLFRRYISIYPLFSVALRMRNAKNSTIS